MRRIIIPGASIIAGLIFVCGWLVFLDLMAPPSPRMTGVIALWGWGTAMFVQTICSRA